MKPLLISVGVDGRDRYSEIINGLEESLQYWDGDVEIHKSFPEYCTPHKHIPYAFKYDLIENAISRGYTKIFYLDCTMRLIEEKNIVQLLDNSKEGIVAFDNLGHLMENYINDTAIKNLDIDSLEGVKQIWGGCTFWDFSKALPNKILAEIKEQIKKGSFNEDGTIRQNFIAHRHDQVVISWLLYKHGIELLPYGTLVSAEHARTKEYGNEYYFIYGD